MRFSDFAEVIESHARATPDKVAWHVDEAAIAWRDLDHCTRIGAQRLRERLSTEPARLALRIDWPAAFLRGLLTVVRAGAAAVPIPARLREAAIVELLTSSHAHALLVSAETAPAMHALAPARRMFDVNELMRVPRGGTASDVTAPTIEPDREMLVLYSSGTTSGPKGVIHTHRTRCAAAENAIRHYHIDANERTLITAPLYTARAIVPLLATAYAGGSSIVVSDPAPRRVLDAVAKHSPTTVDFVPTQLAALLDDPAFDAQVFSGCRLVICTGATLDERLRERAFAAFPASFIEVYGSTEADFVARLPRRSAPEKRGSVGTPRGVQIRVLDGDGEPVADGEVGEIAVCGPATMVGYTDAAATQRAFWVDAQTGERYFRTGDVGRLDRDGYLWLAGRAKDMIITAGFNVYPSDVENVLAQHPAVQHAAVVGLAHEVLGETPLAFVVLKPASDERGARICRWANARLSANQRLYDVRIVPDLPRNASGKVLKSRLRELAQAGT